jgi:hypothetical protein
MDADGLVLDALDAGYAIISVRNNSTATLARIQRLRHLIGIRGLGQESLLKQLDIRQARTSD